jgi:GDP-D-mannose dehydratase
LKLERELGKLLDNQEKLINLHYGDITDPFFIMRTIKAIKPDEIYNLAA